MTQVDARLSDLLEPVRDASVGELLQVLAALLDERVDVVTEPVMRDPAGKVSREGPLSLPRRGDLEVFRDGRTLVRRIESAEPASFEPLCLVAEGGFTTVVNPFRWEAAELLFETRQSRPDWTALRQWFLEWFQPRFTDVSPDLDGVLHALDGPRQGPEGFRFTVDFGSAPVAAFAAMLPAFEQAGGLRVRIGQEA